MRFCNFILFFKIREFDCVGEFVVNLLCYFNLNVIRIWNWIVVVMVLEMDGFDLVVGVGFGVVGLVEN